MTNLQRLIISAMTVCAGILSPVVGRCEETRESKWKFQWGPHVSLNIAGAEDWTRMRQHDPSEIGLGVTAGVYARYVYNNHWYVASGLLVSYAHAPLQVKADVNVDPDSYYTCHFDQGKLSLPIHAGYRILFDDEGERALSFFTGTSLSCGFAGKLKSDRLPGETMYGSDGLWRRFDASWDIGATFEFSDFMVEVCGNLGCVNMARKDVFRDRHMYENACRIGLTYWIPKH